MQGVENADVRPIKIEVRRWDFMVQSAGGYGADLPLGNDGWKFLQKSEVLNGL